MPGAGARWRPPDGRWAVGGSDFAPGGACRSIEVAALAETDGAVRHLSRYGPARS